MQMFIEACRFAFRDKPILGAYMLFKGSAGLAFGAADILNVSFSEIGSEDDESLTSLKLGLLFGSVGIGCIIASVVSDKFTNLSRPLQIARLCISGYLFISVGLFLMALFPNHFLVILLSGIIRSMGAALIYVTSTLLIQKFTPITLLGRIQSIDESFELFCEAIIALCSGLIMDSSGPYRMSPQSLSSLLGIVALSLFFLWSPLAFKVPK
mmetsp:Transcript_50535/g.54629  ORF Transcript_50535/g.54629 Transcript_50535/m.54629 type:complete len:211 (-) Transcript_50535:157-789(-)